MMHTAHKRCQTLDIDFHTLRKSCKKISIYPRFSCVLLNISQAKCSLSLERLYDVTAEKGGYMQWHTVLFSVLGSSIYPHKTVFSQKQESIIVSPIPLSCQLFLSLGSEQSQITKDLLHHLSPLRKFNWGYAHRFIHSAELQVSDVQYSAQGRELWIKDRWRNPSFLATHVMAPRDEQDLDFSSSSRIFYYVFAKIVLEWKSVAYFYLLMAAIKKINSHYLNSM